MPKYSSKSVKSSMPAKRMTPDQNKVMMNPKFNRQSVGSVEYKGKK